MSVVWIHEVWFSVVLGLTKELVDAGKNTVPVTSSLMLNPVRIYSFFPCS